MFWVQNYWHGKIHFTVLYESFWTTKNFPLTERNVSFYIAVMQDFRLKDSYNDKNLLQFVDDMNSISFGSSH